MQLTSTPASVPEPSTEFSNLGLGPLAGNTLVLTGPTICPNFSPNIFLYTSENIETVNVVLSVLTAVIVHTAILYHYRLVYVSGNHG